MSISVTEKVVLNSSKAASIANKQGVFYLIENYCPLDFIEFKTDICELFDINLKDEVCGKYCWTKYI